MEELTNNVNWLAVIVGFVASFLLGWVWYSVRLFGKKWAEGVGVEMDQKASMPAIAMLTQALGTFMLAWLVGITAASNALLTIILVVLTFIVLQIAAGLFTKKSGAAIAIDGGFTLVMAIVMIISQGIF